MSCSCSFKPPERTGSDIENENSDGGSLPLDPDLEAWLDDCNVGEDTKQKVK